MLMHGSTERSYTPKEEASSPTAATESILITGVLEAKEERDVMTLNIPNAFVQASMKKCKVGSRVIMKFRGVLVDCYVKLLLIRVKRLL